ncbi:MAG: hypothetical protein ACOCV2_10730, partial [Persicimonas sp.]
GGEIPRTPFGTALTDRELDIRDALLQIEPLAAQVSDKKFPSLRVDHLYEATRPPEAAEPYLERLGLDEPKGVKETFYQRLVVYGLSAAGHI